MGQFCTALTVFKTPTTRTRSGPESILKDVKVTTSSFEEN